MEEIENNENPFEEEFDKEDVVNSGDLPKDDNSEKKPTKKLIEDSEIQEMIELDEEARRAVAFVEEFGDDEEERESPVIKKADVDKDKSIISADLEDFGNYISKIKKSKSSKIEPDKEDVEIDDINHNEQKSEELEPSEYKEFLKEENRKREDFKDFLKMPKISGKERKFESKHYISSDKLNDRRKHIELIDDPKNQEEHEKTFVEINRDENGEIENITIICKCGEKTMIEFDYLNDNESESTNILNNEIETEPLNYKKELKKEHENIPQMIDEKTIMEEERQIIKPKIERS